MGLRMGLHTMALQCKATDGTSVTLQRRCHEVAMSS